MRNLLQKLSRHLWLQWKSVGVKQFYVYNLYQFFFGLHLLDLPEKAPEAAKPKGRAGSRKAPAKACFCFCFCSYVLFFLEKNFSRTHVDITFSFQPKEQTLVLNDDDDDDDNVLELKERLAAYNLDSSPDQSAGKCYIIIFHQTICYDLYTTQL